MKRIALFVVALSAVAVYAAPDVDPWRKIYEQRQHVVPQKFETEVGAAFIDAGTLTVSGTSKLAVVDAGTVVINNILNLKAPITCGGAAACGSITLSSGTPSTGTATVPAGVVCSCFPVGTTAAIAAGGCAANVSSTTLTVTGPNTVTTVMRYVCWL